jgi:threonine dehydrogenase-like Zn-dependent dehydrogenase
MAEMMRAVVLQGPGELEVQQMPLPAPGPGEELVRVVACGICGSDLRYLAGENPWAKHTLGYEKPNPPGMILGHELAGVVRRGPEDVRVGCLSFRACGVCPACRRGCEQLCANTAHLGHGAGWEGRNPGGMADYCPLWSTHLYPLPEAVSLEEATFLDALAVAVHAVRSAGDLAGEVVGVIGGGPMGLLIAQVAQALGAGPVAVGDVYEAPVACAREVGLAHARCLGDDPAAEWSDWLSQLAPERLAAVFDTTGQADMQAAGLSRLAPGGRLLLMAGVAEGLTLPGGCLAGERRVQTVSNHRYEDFGLALRLLAQRRVSVQAMITHRFPLDRAAEAFAVATAKQVSGALKVLLVP